jgi:hypothetical protein
MSQLPSLALIPTDNAAQHRFLILLAALIERDA